MTARRNSGWRSEQCAAGSMRCARPANARGQCRVDIDYELGTIMRLDAGPGTGPAYAVQQSERLQQRRRARRRIFGSRAQHTPAYRMMLGLPPETHARDLVKLGRTILQDNVLPRASSRPAVQGNMSRQECEPRRAAVAVLERLDGGRYLITYAASSPRIRRPTC